MAKLIWCQESITKKERSLVGDVVLLKNLDRDLYDRILNKVNPSKAAKDLVELAGDGKIYQPIGDAEFQKWLKIHTFEKQNVVYIYAMGSNSVHKRSAECYLVNKNGIRYASIDPLILERWLKQ